MSTLKAELTKASVYVEMAILGVIISPALYFGLPILSYLAWDGNLFQAMGLSEGFRASIVRSVTGLGVDSWMAAITWGFVFAIFFSISSGILGPTVKIIYRTLRYGKDGVASSRKRAKAKA